jgi:hypothetical protein
MAEKTITITLEGTQLTIVPHEVTIGDGDWVRWKFPSDMPANKYGFIFFQPRLGPFHSLRSFSDKGAFEIFGKGNAGAANDTTFSYTAMILQPGVDTPEATGSAKIINKAGTQANTSPDIIVTYTGSGNLSVIPYSVSLNRGDTATWFFKNLPEGSFAGFWFTDPPMFPASGPFATFYACSNPSPDPEEEGFRACGTNFAQGELAAITQFKYRIEIRNAEGKLLASHDPDIDNLGPPPPG